MLTCAWTYHLSFRGWFDDVLHIKKCKHCYCSEEHYTWFISYYGNTDQLLNITYTSVVTMDQILKFQCLGSTCRELIPTNLLQDTILSLVIIVFTFICQLVWTFFVLLFLIFVITMTYLIPSNSLLILGRSHCQPLSQTKFEDTQSQKVFKQNLPIFCTTRCVGSIVLRKILVSITFTCLLP